MIIGTHLLLYSRDPDADRAFFRDVLGFAHVDAGGGWLIFALPPAEIGVHPADESQNLARAHAGNDLATARKLNDRIYPLAKAFYADPWADMHNRMKEALVLLGRLPRAVVRPPLTKLSRAEIERIRAALIEAGLLDAKAARDAA